MPREGPAYPISEKWQKAVRNALDRLRDDDGDALSDARFAEEKAKIAKSSLSEALKPGAIQTTVMPDINRALGWSAPVVLSTPDDLELYFLAESMTEFERGRLIERAKATVEKLRAERKG